MQPSASQVLKGRPASLLPSLPVHLVHSPLLPPAPSPTSETLPQLPPPPFRHLTRTLTLTLTPDPTHSLTPILASTPACVPLSPPSPLTSLAQVPPSLPPPIFARPNPPLPPPSHPARALAAGNWAFPSPSPSIVIHLFCLQNHPFPSLSHSLNTHNRKRDMSAPSSSNQTAAGAGGAVAAPAPPKDFGAAKPLIDADPW